MKSIHICVALAAASIAPASVFAQQEQAADEMYTTYTHGEFTVDYRADHVPLEGVRLVADRVERSLRIIRAFLALSDTYEGPPYDTPLRVVIDPEQFSPYQFGSNIALPEARVLNIVNEVEGARVDIGIIHELAHVLAASYNRSNRDRFYDDGIAVYLQHRFGPTPNYPNFGEDLYIATARAAEIHGGLIPLAITEETRGSAETRIGRQLAYLQEGAFTQFLIERYGLDAYFRIYHGNPLENVTGKSLADLEVEWTVVIESAPVWK